MNYLHIFVLYMGIDVHRRTTTTMATTTHDATSGAYITHMR